MGEYYFSLNDILDKAIGTDAYFQIKSILTSTKPADVAPVRHGHLISTGMDELWAEFGNCTECGGDNYIKAEFCNWCGAKLT